MSRLKKAIQGITTGYLSLGANMVFTILSVPLALNFLSKEDFGLWALITQISGYLLLLDFGMSGSASRLLVDHKDNQDGGAYGSVLKTSFLVFSIQGIIIAIMGPGLAFLLPPLLNIPSEQRDCFTILLILQCIGVGASLAARSIAAPLWGHQRYDVGNYVSIVWFALNLGLLWFGFRNGWGVYSMLLPTAAGPILSAGISFAAVKHMGFLPSKGQWGKINMQTFKELFRFGSDMFFFNFGWQLLSASQIIIITHTLGLEAGAIWAVATKLFGMAQQVVWRLFDYSAGGFSEMIVRGENALLYSRFRDIFILTSSVSILAGSLLAAFNQQFLILWTNGKVFWSPTNDWLMAILLVTYSLSRCHTGLLGLRKELHVMRYLYFVEGLVFAGMSFIFIPKSGLAAIPISAIVANLCLSGAFATYKSVRFFNISFKDVIYWMLPSARFALFFVTILALSQYASFSQSTEFVTFILKAGCCAAIGGILVLWLGLTPDLRQMLFSLLFRGLKLCKTHGS